MALLTLALLPIGVISIYQTQQVIGEAEKLRQAALLFETTSDAADERELIHHQIGAAKGLSSVRGLVNPDLCDRLMQNFVAQDPSVIFAAYIPVNDEFDCASGRNIEALLSRDRVNDALAEERLSVEVMRTGDQASYLPIIVVNQPIERNDQVSGLFSIAIPVRIATGGETESEGNLADFSIATLNRRGEILSATGGTKQSNLFLPADISLAGLVARNGDTFIGMGGDDTRRMYAVVEIIPDEVSAVGSWPVESQALGLSPLQRRIALMFPILMWIAGMAVAYFGLQRQVIRHIRRLRSAMRQFALGERDATGVQLDSPPEEFKELERAFNRMSLILTEAEAKQKSDLADKEVLLREVHHRVKNNLQLIASIMNMQLRSAQSPEAKKLLTDVQRRVNGLAVLHRTLYVTPDMTTIDARDLILAVVSDIARGAPDDHISLDSKLDAVMLYPDQAVPLSMFLTEVLSNAFKFASAPPGEKPSIDVKLREHLSGAIDLSVINSKDPSLEEQTGSSPASGLGTRLMNAFVRQLDGEQIVDETADRKAVTLRFHRENFEAQA